MAAALQPGGQQQLLDLDLQPVPLAGRHVDQLLALGVGELALAGAQGGQRAQHAGQRRAQLVGDGGQQVVLEPVALPQPLDQGVLGLGEPGLLGGDEPSLGARLLGDGPALVGLDRGLQRGPYREQRQQQQRQQADLVLGHHQHDRRHAEDHHERQGLDP